MNKNKVNPNVQAISEELAINSFKSDEVYFPIDRFFINKNNRLDQILSLDKFEFILYNLNRNSNTYTVQLFFCLPEIWKDMLYEDFLYLINCLNDEFSIYAFIEFTYKYLRINFFEEIVNSNQISSELKRKCVTYFSKTIKSLYNDEEDDDEFLLNNLGVDIIEWNKIIMKFHSDKRIKKILAIKELNSYLLTQMNLIL